MKKSVVRFGVIGAGMCILWLLSYLIVYAAVYTGQACFALGTGDSRRSSQCIGPGTACQSTLACTDGAYCYDGDKAFGVASCKNYRELSEHKCRPMTIYCCKDAAPVECMNWDAYYVYTNCTGLSCVLHTLGDNCSTLGL
jgi:hypothetical protein